MSLARTCRVTGWRVVALGLAGAVAAPACHPPGEAPGPDAAAPSDAAVPPAAPDLLRCGDALADPCVDDPGSRRFHRAAYGPDQGGFPLGLDPQNRSPLVLDAGLTRDARGGLVAASMLPRSILWIAGTNDLRGAGTISRLDATSVREVARYPAFTCRSLRTGMPGPCDGKNGCCALDDPARYQARRAGQPEPAYQGLSESSLLPSRLAIDYDGDVLVANPTPGGVSSLTRIAFDRSSCIDRNHNGVIDTSTDADSDGYITVDCNHDGYPDDLADVKAKPCDGGLVEEYFGQDDECVLWTTNTFQPGDRTGALALVPGPGPTSDAWLAASNSGRLTRVDGTTGLIIDDGVLPGACLQGGGPAAMQVDAQGAVWVAPAGTGKLCYFDGRAPRTTSVAREPAWGPVGGFSIAVDRDQNVWLGGQLARYTPDRTNGLQNLGGGWWTRIGDQGGLGLAVDARAPNAFFVWACDGVGHKVLRVPASTIARAPGDRIEPLGDWPAIDMDCWNVDVDGNQSVWGISPTTSTRALVDANGHIKAPVRAAPRNDHRCPAGDSCPNDGAQYLGPGALPPARDGFTPTYDVLVEGCRDAQGNPAPTAWGTLRWDADVPDGASLTVRARAGRAPDRRDIAWERSEWTRPLPGAPACLQGPLPGNLGPGGALDGGAGAPSAFIDGWLEVEFTFQAPPSASPPLALRGFDVSFRCLE